MNLLKTSISAVPHVIRYVMVGAVVLVISLLFPSETNFEYKYQLGERWLYDDLMAPFDFPIRKSEAMLQTERQQIERSFTPYYRLDTGTLDRQKQLFHRSFQERYRELGTDQLRPDSSVYLRFGDQILQHLYESKKIIELSEAHKTERNLVFELLVGHSDEGEHSPDEYWTPKRALQFVFDTLQQSERQFNQPTLLLHALEEASIAPNIVFDQALTDKRKAATLQQLSPFQGLVRAGEPIAVRNGWVDSLVYAKLQSFEIKYEEETQSAKNGFFIYFGYLVLTIALFSIFLIFVQFYERDVFAHPRYLLFVLSLIAAFSYIAYFIKQVPLLDLYLVPFCIVPLIVQNFFSAQLALFSHLVVILLASMLLSLDYQFILIQILVGMVAIITKLKTRYLSDFFVTILYIGIAYTTGFLSLELIRTGTIFPVLSDDGGVIQEGVRWTVMGWVGMNIFLTLLSYPLIPLLERLIGLTSEITLVELSDLNNPLLKELSLKAPGTLQHSLQVANLSEAAASAIGANSLLVKVAALYHDIGKMLHPTFFIENQAHGNPHENLSYLESAEMIISHVTEGVKLAKKYHLPAVLIDFILTHHGTTRVEYFYRLYVNENPDIEVDESKFRYPGPRPRNREEAILMMADSLEAASKSLKQPQEKDIDDLTEKIIAGKISNGQLNDTNLSFKELEIIKSVFKKLLKSINHVRIQYPDEKK